MKKIMNKKVKIFKKEISVFLIVLVGVIGLVSAALLPYFAQITGLVSVEQGLKMDGKLWNNEFDQYVNTLTSLEEKTVSSGVHTLENTATTANAEVKLTTTCVEGIAENDGCDDVTTYPLFKLSIDGSISVDGAGISMQDRVVAKSNVNVNDITSLSFAYDLTTTTNGLSPYFVLALDLNGNGVYDYGVDVNVVSFQENGVLDGEWHTHNGVTQTWHVGGSSVVKTFAEIQSEYTGKKVLQVKVMIGYWGDLTPTTALVKNINVDGVDVVKDNGLVIRHSDEIGTQWYTEDDKEYGDVIVDFSIETDFPKLTKPDTYTFTTQVLPVVEE